MSLPTIATPQFTTVIPSTGKEVEFRPFLVKEEKILLMALEGGDQNEMVKATHQIIDACLITKVDTHKLSTFDIEHLFLQIRGKSVGEVIEMKVRHTDDTECNHVQTVAINLEDIKVDGEIQDGKIMITDDVGIKLRYPTMYDIELLEDDESLYDVINNCIEYVFDKETVYSDYTKEEIKSWIDNLNQQQFGMISKFMEDIPRLRHEIKWKCNACGKDDSIMVEGLSSFFT